MNGTEQQPPPAPGTTTGTRSVPRLIPVIVSVLLVAVLATVIIVVVLGGGSPNPPPSTPSIAPGAAHTIPIESAEPLPPATKADPVSIAIHEIGVQTEVVTYTVAMAQDASNPLTGDPCYANDRIACVNPPSYTNVAWLRAGEGGIPFGDQPGVDASGTVYLVGHGSSTVEAVFNRLHELNIGSPIDVTTANGTVRYFVEEVVVLEKSSWSSSPYANEQVPGRLILGTCNHAEGAETTDGGWATQNVLIVAQTGTRLVIGG